MAFTGGKKCKCCDRAAAKLEFAPEWETELAQVKNPALTYPDYYLRPFHAYDQGNMGWEAAMEVEVAAHAVHAKIWQDAGAKGDGMLRQSYHDVLQKQIAIAPQAILDIGCSVGMSTFALQNIYPQAQITGLDLSPYFLAIAQYQSFKSRACPLLRPGSMPPPKRPDCLMLPSISFQHT